MAIDVDQVYSPGWWLMQLSEKLNGRMERLERLRRYADGDADLPESAESVRKSYAAFQRKARLNMAELMVSSVRERMHVRAIQTAQPTNDERGDEAARALFDANQLDVELPDVLDNMLALGDAYMIAGRYGSDGGGDPVLTGEDPRQGVTIHDPVRQSEVLAAAKFYSDPIQQLDYAILWVRGGNVPGVAETRRWVAARPAGRGNRSVRFDSHSWGWVKGLHAADPTGELGLPTGTERVPVVRFRNRRAQGIFEIHIDHIDRINHGILQRVIIATMQAYRQRAIKGDLPEVYPDSHPRAGERIDYNDIFRADPGALWMLPETAEMWESGQVDLNGVLRSVEDDIKQLAAVSRMPLSIFNPESGNQSAQGAILSREGLVHATRTAMTRAGRAVAAGFELMFELGNDTDRAKRGTVTIEWEPPDPSSILDQAQAAMNAKAAGMSKAWIMQSVFGMTPQQQKREAAAFRTEQWMLPPAPETVSA